MMSLTDKLKDKFGIEDLSPGALDRFTGGNFTLEDDLVETVIEFPDELAEQGILLWADNRTHYADQHEKLLQVLRAQFGGHYEHYIAARSILYAVEASRPLNQLQQLFCFLKEHQIPIRSGEEWATHFGSGNDFSEVMRKLETHKKLTNNRLNGFYGDDEVALFNLGEYTVTASRGFYEHQGGFCLSLHDQEGELVYVSGWLHNNKTRVVSIHGAKPPEEDSTEVTKRMSVFKENTGLHPANLALLIYLKLGERLGHKDIRIRGSASPVHNRQGEDSPFYTIPRDYFRLRTNPESGYYEFEATKREALLSKFARKSETVNTAYQKIDEYLA